MRLLPLRLKQLDDLGEEEVVRTYLELGSTKKLTQLLYEAEGVGFEPTRACARRFSSSTKVFACVFVWLYLATLRGFFGPALFI